MCHDKDYARKAPGNQSVQMPSLQHVAAYLLTLLKKISRANPKTVLLVSDLEFRSARELVSGVSDFMREHTPWRLRFVTRTQDFTSETVRSLEANGIDGVIATTCGSSETRKALEGSSVPLVIFGLPNDELHARQNNIA